MINMDLTSVGAVLGELEPQLVATLHGDHRPTASRLLIARELRRTVFVAVGHRFAMTLLPVTIELLAGRHPVEVVRTSQLLGARGRVFYDDSATVAATIRSLLAPVRRGMYEDWTASERSIVFGEVARLTRDVSKWAEILYRELYGSAWTDDDPYLVEPGTDRPFRSRTLRFLAAGLDPDLDGSLRGSELGQAEHLSVALADLHQAFAAAGCPPGAQVPTALEHLEVLGDLAALRDETAEKIVFEPDHTPLYEVSAKAEAPGWTIRSLRAPLNASVQARPGRCPAVSALRPVGDKHRALAAAFAAQLTEITGGRGRAENAPSAATVSSALSVAVADELVNRRGVQLTGHLEKTSPPTGGQSRCGAHVVDS
jgi:hypothetical protein